MRKKIVVGNWKMNLLRDEGILLVNNILKSKFNDKINVVLAPSFLHLYKVSKMTSSFKNITTSAQDCSSSASNSLTGSVSVEMISSCGVKYVIIGHSERRSKFNETNIQLQAKANMAISNKLNVIFCCGENIEKRKNNSYFDFLKNQITEGIFHLNAKQFSNVVIAYEPIWAIGSGNTASSFQAQEVHEFIRDLIKIRYNETVASNTSILYGGSCNNINAKELFSQKDIDGGLIGGASLSAENFVSIINSF
ncbi:MAG: triose-phosphate isomerase [Flavobacteriales bacterium]|nr:triose-phosphate isomerase [Flavobacteriales bacterium]MDG2086543.1 triose-phosphate isomerase [Flavobacteriales bacterium]